MKTKSYRKTLFVIAVVSVMLLANTASWGAFEVLIPGSDNMIPIAWTRGCTPTSAAMVLNYWDEYSGYGRLTDYWGELSAFSTGGYMMNAPMSLLEELRLLMFTNEEGRTYDEWQSPGIEAVANGLNGYCFSSEWIEGYTCSELGCWDKIVTEIDAGRPFVWNVTAYQEDLAKWDAHSVAAWGFRIDDKGNKYVVVYDTWSTYRDDWDYMEYDNKWDASSIDIHTVVPGCASNGTIELYEPSGDEMFHPGEIVPIEWYQWGTDIDYVHIYYSTDGGVNWWVINSGRPSVLNWNSINWTIPNGYTDKARIKISAYDAQHNYIAGDGSHANFSIQPFPPSAPSNLTVTEVCQGIKFTWKDNSNNEEGFKIQVSGSPTGPWADQATGLVDATYTETADLLNGECFGWRHYYRVVAYNGGGDSSPSNVVERDVCDSPRESPAKPTFLTATPQCGNSVLLTWSNSENEAGYVIQQALSLAGPFTVISEAGVDVTTYTAAGLSPGITYYFRVTAFNLCGDSDPSDVVSGSPLPAPAAPGNLTATAVSPSQINLAWNANPNATEYAIYCKVSSHPWTIDPIALVDKNVTSFAHTGLTSCTAYSYIVKATNAAGCESPASNTAEATTRCVPNPPGNLIATAVSASQINLTFTDTATNEQGFKVERTTSPSGLYWKEIATLGVNAGSYANMALSPCTTYFYRIRTYNAEGYSAYSNTVSAKTLGCTTTTTSLPTTTTTSISIPVPNPPGNLSATAVSSGQINLSWTDNATNEVAFYIERAPDVTGSPGAFALIQILPPNITTHHDTGLSSCAKYHYRVNAYNSSGYSAYSNTASATTLGCNTTTTSILPTTSIPTTTSTTTTTSIPVTGPNPPSSLNATAVSSSSIRLSWTDNSNDETGFEIYRATFPVGPYSLVATVAANVTSFTNSGLAACKTYFYGVRAFNTNGNSGYTSASAKTLGCANTDTDADGILDAEDNCPTNCNVQQLDADGDGIGDVCDTSPGCGGCGQPQCEQQC